MTAAVLPPVIGHRGAAGLAPENTLAGLRAAARSGVAWVEFDITLTADGQPILFHDDTLERTTNGTGRGMVGAYTLAALRRLDAGSWFGEAFRGEPIPTLAEAIAVLDAFRLGANVELKPAPRRETETARIVVAALSEHWPAALPPPLISSFNEAALAAVPGDVAFPRALLVEEVPADWRARLSRLDCAALHCQASTLSIEQAREIRAAGVPLRCYTVNDPAEARRLFAWGVEAVFSDVPDRILAGYPPASRSDFDAGSNTR